MDFFKFLPNCAQIRLGGFRHIYHIHLSNLDSYNDSLAISCHEKICGSLRLECRLLLLKCRGFPLRWDGPGVAMAPNPGLTGTGHISVSSDEAEIKDRGGQRWTEMDRGFASHGGPLFQLP